jgi:hypothetical protein
MAGMCGPTSANTGQIWGTNSTFIVMGGPQGHVALGMNILFFWVVADARSC